MDYNRRDLLRFAAATALSSCTAGIANAADFSVDRAVSPLEIETARNVLAGIRLPHLDVPNRVGTRQLAYTSGQPSAFVDDATVMSCVANLSPQHQEDMLASMLLAQQAATFKYNPEQSPIDWYKYYHYVLSNLGWAMQEFAFTDFQSSGGSFSVSQDVIKILLALATGGESAVVSATLEALKNLSDSDERVVLFDAGATRWIKGISELASHQMQAGLLPRRFLRCIFTPPRT